MTLFNDKILTKFAIFTCILLFLAEIATADTLSLSNGDIIRGEIIAVNEGKLVVETEYGGEIPVKIDFINTLETSNPVTIKLNDDSYFTGILTASQSGHIYLKPEDSSETLWINLSQISEFNPPLTEKKTKFSGYVNVGGIKTSGNSEKQTFHTDAEIIARGEKRRASIGVQYNQGADDGKESENNTRVNLQYDHFISKKWYTYVNTDFTRDRFQDLELRSTVSSGMGIQFLETDIVNVSLEGGPTYVKETFFEGTARDFVSSRWAFKFSLWLFEKKYELFHDHEGLFSSEDTSDFLVRSHTGLRFPLLKRFDLSTQVDNDYDNKPSEGNQKNDTRFIIGLGYNF